MNFKKLCSRLHNATEQAVAFENAVKISLIWEIYNVVTLMPKILNFVKVGVKKTLSKIKVNGR
jgi:hypothetical protein